LFFLEAPLAIDIIVLLLVLAGLYYGLRHGLVGAMTHLVSIPVGLACLIRVSPVVSGWLQQWLPRLPASVCGWVLTAMLTGLAIALLLRLANAVLNRAGLQTANRLIGGWCGVVGVVLVLALGHMAMGFAAPQRWNAFTDRHVSMRCLRAVAQEIEGRMPEHVLPQQTDE